MTSPQRWAALVLASALSVGLAAPVTAQLGERDFSQGVMAALLFSKPVRGIALSPNGMLLAGTSEDAICLLHIDTASERCIALPDDFVSDLTASPTRSALLWSPDGRYIAFAGDSLTLFVDGDVWLLDVQEGTIRNRTDDGLQGSLFDAERVLIDYALAWTPDSQVVFLRMAGPTLDDTLETTLQRVDPSNDAPPETLADLRAVLPPFGTVSTPAVSPDGSRLALDVQTGDASDTRTGLWIIDLATGAAKQVVSPGFPAGYGPALERRATEGVVFRPVWTADGQGIVVYTQGFDQPLVVNLTNFLYVDADAGGTQPIVDLTHVDTMVDLLTIETQLRIPRDAALSADGTRLIYMTQNDDLLPAALWAAPLPPAGEAPVLLAEVEFELTPFAPNPQVAANGRVLLGGWLYTLPSPAGG